MKKYTNVALPEELVAEIKKAIEKSNLGYKSKSEFVKEAIRNSLKDLAEYEALKKNKIQRKKS